MKKVKLGEVCEILSGYAFKSSQFNDNKIGLPLIRIRDVERGFSDTYFEGTYPEEYLIKNGDLLITMDGSFILKKWEGDLALLNQRVCKIKITDKSVDEGYISWLIPKFLKEIEDKTPFVTVKHLSVAKIKDISFVLPNKLEQKLIAKKLNTISQIYDFRKIQSEKFNELVKSRFNEMFGENKIFESIDNLFDIIDGDRGKNYPKSDELFSEEYCLFLNTKNVTKNGFSFDTKQFITKTKDKLLRKGKLERYDIVLTTRGTVGNVAYYDELIKYKHLRIKSGMVILRPKTPNLNQKFIIHVLRNNNYSRVISGSAQPQLPITKLKKILLPLPPLALQNEFADFVVQVDKSQLAIQKSLEELETLKKSLMQEYFG
ncbi:TPA: restriction endonuclease subunit S [Streptococcus pneumoniae]|nr:restriction endonuclease subunit S [Streptococcus pneumoniae]HEU6853867.1 restriction endonuclease subunit S [Streptococcus pneumoniae]HEU8227635.1 restriction endonuclease subunit S [Streptococcus pneumoniae]